MTARARSSAEELYVERVLAFNDRVDQIRRDNERCVVVVVVVVVLSKKMLLLVLSLYHEKYIFIYLNITSQYILHIYI